jgi:hypothetical protein
MAANSDRLNGRTEHSNNRVFAILRHSASRRAGTKKGRRIALGNPSAFFAQAFNPLQPKPSNLTV